MGAPEYRPEIPESTRFDAIFNSFLTYEGAGDAKWVNRSFAKNR